MKQIFIFTNNKQASEELSQKLKTILNSSGHIINPIYSQNTDIVIAIGGDGTILNAFSHIGFTHTPVLGINTGHLGFFSEINPEDIECIPKLIESADYYLQKNRTIKAEVETDSDRFVLDNALNDILVRHLSSSLIHLKICIGESFIESFSGDGILIASPAGSTGYNYSLGGSIVDPRLNLLQLTPVAPVNNRAYRSFTSSIVLPAEQKIIIEPEDEKEAMITIDGNQHSFKDINKITIYLSENEVNIVRLKDYDFWNKVKSKFL